MSRRLLAILALALGVRVFAFCGYVGQPDEITIVEMVQEIQGGSWPRFEDRILEKVFPTRIGYAGVTAALVGLFGVSDFSYTIYSLFCSLGTLVLTYLLGRRWLGEDGGLLAALLFAFFPLDVIYATKISGDPPLVFLCTLSVYLFFLADDSLPRGRRGLVALLAGCVIGFAYLHKVTAGYFCVLFALIGTVDMIRRRRVMLRYVMLALGFGLMFCAEMAFQYKVNADPFYGWHVMMEQARSAELREALHAEERLHGWRDDVKRLFWTFPLRSLVSLRQGFYYWFIFPAVAYCLLFRRRDLWAPLVWWVFIAVFLNLSTIGGKRLPFYARQLYLIVPPGMILLSAALIGLRQWPPLRAGAARGSLRVLLVLFSALSFVLFASLLAFHDSLVPWMARFYASKHTVMPESFVEWGLGLCFRYGMAAVFGVACLFLMLSRLARRLERAGSETWPGGVLALTITGFLAVTSVTIAYASNRGVPRVEKEAYTALLRLPPKTVYADWFTKKILRFYSGFPAEDRIVVLQDVDPARLRDGYLVYNAFRKNMREDLSDLTDKVQSGDLYLYPYEKIDRVIGDDWEVAYRGRDDLVVIYLVP